MTFAVVLVPLAAAVKVASIVFMFVSAFHMLHCAHLMTLRTFASDMGTRWIVFFVGGGWCIHEAVVLGSVVRDPQMALGSLVTMKEPQSKCVRVAHFTNVAHPILVRVTETTSTLQIMPDDVIITNSMNAPIRARFERCEVALQFLRAIHCTRAPRCNAVSSERRVLGADASLGVCTQHARPHDVAMVHMWVFVAGSALLVAHESVSLADWIFQRSLETHRPRMLVAHASQRSDLVDAIVSNQLIYSALAHFLASLFGHWALNEISLIFLRVAKI